MAERIIYLDHASTTPVAPEVLEAMLPYFTRQPGNPSSIHQLGRAALQALDDARDTIAEILGATPREIIFTASGSEGDNLAIRGVALAQRDQRRGAHLVTTAIEHHAVLHTVEALVAQGFEATIVPVDRDGIVSPAAIEAALRPDTVLVSVMYANNEIGTVQPIAEIGAICRAHGIPFHSDAVQAPGQLLLNVAQLNVDLLTIAAHKFYGPKGVGALYIRRGTPLLPQISGGSQERRRRAGTENTPGIVGMAAALRLAEQRRELDVRSCIQLRDRLIDAILAAVPGTQLNGHRQQRLPNNANIAFDGVEGESILLLLDQHQICASSGSACSAGSLEPSHVILAMGYAPERAHASVRFSVGRSVTADDIEHTIAVIPPIIAQLRDVAPQAR